MHGADTTLAGSWFWVLVDVVLDSLQEESMLTSCLCVPVSQCQLLPSSGHLISQCARMLKRSPAQYWKKQNKTIVCLRPYT